MMVIFDDTFIDRHKYNDIEYLKEIEYQKVCKIYTVVKTTELAQILKSISSCKAFFNHKSLQLYNNEGEALDIKENTNFREVLLNKIAQLGVPRIEFSRGLETNFEAKKIDKDLFYNNLKSFLDYYIEKGLIEIKILFWGKDFQEREMLSIIQKMLLQIRIAEPQDYSNNQMIHDGLKILFPDQSSDSIINEWNKNKLSKNEIIQVINKYII